MPRGGKRPGAGLKKGTKLGPNASTLSKEAARECLRQAVLKHMDMMIAAQVAHATGLKYLVTRDKKTGKFVRVTEAMARIKLGDAEEVVEIWEKDPSVPAFTDLMNRALDKPAEQKQQIELTGDDALIAALLNGRKRVAEAKQA